VCVYVCRATGEEDKKNIYNNNIILLYVNVIQYARIIYIYYIECKGREKSLMY